MSILSEKQKFCNPQPFPHFGTTCPGCKNRIENTGVLLKFDAERIGQVFEVFLCLDCWRHVFMPESTNLADWQRLATIMDGIRNHCNAMLAELGVAQ
jgi:hypothetical protein